MNQDPKSVPLAVVGVGCLFPKAKTLREYWANVKNKVDAIRDVPPSHWRHEDYFDKDPKKPDHVYAYKGGFLEPYDFDCSEFGLAPNTLEATIPPLPASVSSAGTSWRTPSWLSTPASSTAVSPLPAPTGPTGAGSSSPSCAPPVLTSSACRRRRRLPTGCSWKEWAPTRRVPLSSARGGTPTGAPSCGPRSVWISSRGEEGGD